MLGLGPTFATTGQTWIDPTPHPEMPDPSCKGGITRWSGAVSGKTQQALFATSVGSTTLRVNQTVYASTNGGKSFDTKLKIDTSGGYGTINVRHWWGSFPTVLALG